MRQEPGFCVYTHPVSGTQASFVHASASVQAWVVPPAAHFPARQVRAVVSVVPEHVAAAQTFPSTAEVQAFGLATASQTWQEFAGFASPSL
jgi:hypothetical protein